MTPDRSTAQVRVLLVGPEDHTGALRRVLREQGFTRLKTAADLDRLAELERGFDPDLILLGVISPAAGGPSPARLKSVLQSPGRAPIVVFANLANSESARTAREALEWGAEDLLTQPFEGAEVALRLHRLLEPPPKAARRDQDRPRGDAALPRRVVEASQDMIFVVDSGRAIEYVNPAVARQFGIAPKSMEGLSTEQLFPPPVAGRLLAYLDEVFTTGESAYHEILIDLPAGEKWLGTWLTPLRDDSEETTAVMGVSRDIGELKRTEEALQASEAKYRVIRENIDEIIYIVSDIVGAPFSGRVEHVSEKVARILGYPPEDFSADPGLWRRLVHPDDAMAVWESTRKIFQSKQPGVREYRIRHKNSGEYRWMEDRVNLHLNESGEPVGIVGVARDITERRRAEDTLRESQEKFRAAFENAPIGMAIASPDDRLIQVNRALCEILGYSREELLQTTIPAITHPSDRYIERRFKAESRRRGFSSFQLSKRYLHSDGHIVWGKLAVSTVRDEAGEPLYYIGQLEDVTEVKRATEELTKLRKAVESSGEVVFMTDREGVFTFVNPAFTALYGFAAEELIGKSTPRILKSGKQDDSYYGALWREILNKRPVRGEFVNKTKDGRFLSIEAAIDPVLGDDGEIIGFLAIQRDVSERKESEEERRKLEAQFRQAQKMEAVGRLAGGVAHDFNNMLNVILGYAELALLKLDPEAAVRANIEEVVKAARHSADLTRQLLAFARKQTAAPRTLDVNELIGQSEKMLARLLSENIQLTFEPGAALWPAHIDPTQVNQMLTNLAVNSRDAISEGGQILIETRNATLDETYCENHPGATPGEFVCIAFRDNGCGMDSETLSRIFEPFFTTKEKGKGTGLGLATVYGIVKQNNGFIDAMSVAGEGAVFEIYLPRAETEPKRPRKEDAPAPRLRGTETVLVVEDAPQVNQLCRHALEGAGFTVLSSNSPGGALRLAERHGKKIQILVTDVVMPNINGKELSRQIEAFAPEIRTIFMSGYAADVLGPHGILEPGQRFLQKPFSPRDLVRKVRETLDQPG